MLKRALFLRFPLCPAAAAFYGASITTTPRLWDRIQAVNEREKKSNLDQYLRLQISSGGCQGFQYEFLFESKDKFDSDEDIVFRRGDELRWSGAEPSAQEPPEGIPTFVVDKITLSKLQQATIDYHSELKGSAFVVVGNMLVDQSCACAQSFSMRKKTD